MLVNTVNIKSEQEQPDRKLRLGLQLPNNNSVIM